VVTVGESVMTAYGAFDGGIGAPARQVITTPNLGPLFLKVRGRKLILKHPIIANAPSDFVCSTADLDHLHDYHQVVCSSILQAHLYHTQIPNCGLHHDGACYGLVACFHHS